MWRGKRPARHVSCSYCLKTMCVPSPSFSGASGIVTPLEVSNSQVAICPAAALMHSPRAPPSRPRAAHQYGYNTPGRSRAAYHSSAAASLQAPSLAPVPSTHSTPSTLAPRCITIVITKLSRKTPTVSGMGIDYRVPSRQTAS